MRCYFHLMKGPYVIPDDTGVEVTNVQAAQHQALQAIQEMRQEGSLSDDDWRGWRLNVVCPLGTVLLSLRLDMPLDR